MKELLGHSTITVTMRYAHSNHETKARAVAKLPTCDKPVTVIPRKAKKPNGSSDSTRKMKESGTIGRRRNGRVVEGGGLENR